MVTIEIIERLRIKIKNMTKFKSPIHSIRGLIKEKIDLEEPLIFLPSDHYIGQKKIYLNYIKK